MSVLPQGNLGPVSGVISNAQTTSSSCPQNRTLHIVSEPIPNSLNSLDFAGDSPPVIYSMEKLSLTPFPDLPNGSLDWSSAATDWYSSNANYTQWTFNIKPGLKWSDGVNVSSQDVLRTFNSSFAFNPQYDFLGIHTEVAKEYALNSSATVFVLNKTDAHLPEELGSFYFANLEPLNDTSQGPAYNEFGTDVADGPFYVSGYSSGATTLVMKPNPYYTPHPAICEVDVSLVESTSLEAQFLEAGQTDFAPLLPPGSVSPLLSLPNIHLFDQKGQIASFLDYNVTEYPFNMTQFKQALAFGINDSQIVQQADFGYGLPGNIAPGGVPSSVPWYNPNTTQYTFNQTESLKLLQSIGFTKGSDGTLHYPNGTAVTFTLWTDTGKAEDPIAAGIIQQNLAGLGISINVQTETASNLIGDFGSNAFNINNELALYSSAGALFSSPWVDAQPECNVWGPLPCHSNVLWPPSAAKDYQGNLTAVDGTANLTLEKQYLDNIQAINAQYLPLLPLAYPDTLIGYSTARFSNWPSPPSEVLIPPTHMNLTMVASLTPTSSGTNSTSTVSSSSVTSIESSASLTTATTSSGAATTLTSTTASSSSTGSTSTSSQTLLYAAVAVIIILIIAGVAATMYRRGRRPRA